MRDNVTTVASLKAVQTAAGHEGPGNSPTCAARHQSQARASQRGHNIMLLRLFLLSPDHRALAKIGTVLGDEPNHGGVIPGPCAGPFRPSEAPLVDVWHA